MISLAETDVEQAALAWLESLGWRVMHGLEIASGEAGVERSDYAQVVLEARLRYGLGGLNPALPTEAVDGAFRKPTRTDAPSLVERNRGAHRMVVDGVTVEYRRKDGSSPALPSGIGR